MKILVCSSEVFPYAKIGGLADVAGALPLALERQGFDVSIALPRYKCVDESKFKLKKISDTVSYAALGKGIKVYFIVNDAYFNREGLYGDKFGDHKDNLDRFSFYCRETLNLIKETDFKPDIIHCNDWQTGLIPVYLKSNLKNDVFYKDIRTVLTIHNLAYQGIFAKEEFTKLSLDGRLFSAEGLEFYDKINLLKGGIVFSDVVNTVSSTYAKEILTEEFGCGLNGSLSAKKENIFGILNGLDYEIWDPEKDKFIFKNYSLKTIEDKYINKRKFQEELGLETSKQPLFGMVSRLAQQKGLDLIDEGIEEICKNSAQVVILGTGEKRYHEMLENIAKKYPNKISVHLKFDESLAHKIYAASDVFLMPSHYEPCGLGQMISFKYGTLPLAFKTGGLADTVSSDNGFIFDIYNKDMFLDAFHKAVSLYEDKCKWSNLVKRALGYNFSWDESARKYTDLYKKCLSR